MIRVFICYGGSNGREIGLRLRSYLLEQGMRPFLVGRGSPDIPAGENLDVIIDQKLRNTHVMVTVCDQNLTRSKYARKEIQIAEEEGILNIIFRIRGLNTPKKLRRIWAPIDYDHANPGQSFPLLMVEIHRSVEFRTAKYFQTLGVNPENGIPLPVVRITSGARRD